MMFVRWPLFLVCLLCGNGMAQPPVTALAFSPAGDRLLVGSQSGIDVRTWPSLDVVERVESELSQIHELRFSPDGTKLIVVGGSPSEFGEVDVIAWPERKCLASGVEHDDVIYSAVWLANDRFVTGGADNQLIEWELADNNLVDTKRLNGHSRRVLAVEAVSRARIVVSAGVDQSLRVWKESSAQRVLDNHQGIVRDLAVRPGDDAIPYVASASADKTVRLWQPTIGRLVRFARLPVEPLSIAWTNDGKYLAVACVDGKLRIVNTTTVKIVAELAAVEGWAYEVLAARDGSFVVGGAKGQLVRVVAPWDQLSK